MIKHDVIAAEAAECADWPEVQRFLHGHEAPPHALAKGETTVTYWERNQMISVLKVKAGFMVVRVRYDLDDSTKPDPIPAKVHHD